MKQPEPISQPPLLLRTLADLRKSKKLCEVEVENPKDSFFCKVMDSNDLMTLIHKILPDSGEFDGFSLLFTDNISTVSWEGDLLEQLEILLEEKGNHKNILDKIANISIHNHFFKVIRTINSLYGHISVYHAETNNDFYFGQVKDIDEEFMLLRLMGDKFAMDDRNIVIRLADIGRIDFGGIYDENMLRLHKIKKKIAVR